MLDMVSLSGFSKKAPVMDEKVIVALLSPLIASFAGRGVSRIPFDRESEEPSIRAARKSVRLENWMDAESAAGPS
ncbi:hypothetical protein [Methylocystis sp. ATCC 49242]|uniref:hypothetical protein n=1 Tax=Methylocystis sp. ATCC 49242 TaxID=622637 RepID=UPI0011866AC5|nr:hypothetical protein [Methylocystis sp. ATCC 49242]